MLWKPLNHVNVQCWAVPKDALACYSKSFQVEIRGFHILKLKIYSKYASVNLLLFYLRSQWPPHDSTSFTGRLGQFIKIMSTLWGLTRKRNYRNWKCKINNDGNWTAIKYISLTYHFTSQDADLGAPWWCSS